MAKLNKIYLAGAFFNDELQKFQNLFTGKKYSFLKKYWQEAQQVLDDLNERKIQHNKGERNYADRSKVNNLDE